MRLEFPSLDWRLRPISSGLNLRGMNAMESMLASVTDNLEASALKALVEMRASAEAAERMQWLAERANEGLLTEEERHEYDSAISFGNFLGLLQSKARLKLKSAA
jgi:hypothetical protein